MARKTAKRNKKGQFVKGRKTTRKRKAAPKRRRNPAPARRRAPAKRRRAPARAKRRAPARRRRARRNPKMNPIWEALVAGAVAAGADVLIDSFVAPMWPRGAAWGSPILKVAGGWYLHDRTKMKTAGAGLMAIGAAELATALIAAGQTMLGVTPPVAKPSEGWANWGGNFPRAQLGHALSNQDTIESYAANRRVTDPVPTPASVGFGNGYYGGVNRGNMAQAL